MNEPSPARQPFATVRPSACPGLLRIAQALDGGICRVKLAGSTLSANQADAVAVAAARYASGVIEATNRGNLQIRGVGEQAGDLAEALLAAGLGPRDAGADDVRNLMLSPTAGLDPQARFDTRPLAAQILHSLESEPRWHALSAKFALQLDGGERLAMLEHHHDVWLAPLELEGSLWLGLGLASSPAEGAMLVAVPLAEGHRLTMAVLGAFLDCARAEHHRMRDLLAHMPVEAFLQRLALPLRRGPFAPQPRRERAQRPLGVVGQARPGYVSVAAAPVLGRLSANQLQGVAQAARSYGDGSLRLTPWQSLILPNVPFEHASTSLQRLARLGLQVDSEQPLAHLVACTGSSGCSKAQADTKADALTLAKLLDVAQEVHLTGCPRSCAAAHDVPATLLATHGGHYELYLRDGSGPGFGVLQARGLTLQAASALLNARVRSSTDD